MKDDQENNGQVKHIWQEAVDFFGVDSPEMDKVVELWQGLSQKMPDASGNEFAEQFRSQVYDLCTDTLFEAIGKPRWSDEEDRATLVMRPKVLKGSEHIEEELGDLKTLVNRVFKKYGSQDKKTHQVLNAIEASNAFAPEIEEPEKTVGRLIHLQGYINRDILNYDLI